MPILDTQRVTDDLVAAGLPQPQARAVTAKLEEAAQAARGNLVTVQDLDQAKAELKGDIADLRSDMNVRFAEADAKHAERVRNHFIALVAVMVSVAGVTLAIVKLLG
jgi:hypothetical protein